MAPCDAPGLHWLDLADLAAPAPAGRFLALVTDLASPGALFLDRLAPTPEDIADRARPIAGVRTWFLRRRALLRHLVAHQCGCRPGDVVIAHDDEGAPRVIAPDAQLFVSVSARGSLAACAISPTPVGIDLEIIDESAQPVAQVLTATERAALNLLPSNEVSLRFMSIWTSKEAYLKASGLGLKRDPASIDVELTGDTNFVVDDPQAGPQRWQGAFLMHDFNSARIICACITLAP